MVAIGIAFVAISPLTLPDSPSSAFGQLLLLLAGPSLLVFCALWLKLAGNHPLFGRRTILLMQSVAALWLVLLWVSAPEFAGEKNAFWQLWWSSTLLIAAVFMFVVANFVSRNAALLFAALGMSLLIGFSMLETPSTSSAAFRDSSVDSLAMIFGALAGMGSAMVCWFFIVQRFHADEAEFPLAEPLDDAERKQLETRLAEDLEWLKSSRGDDDE